MKKIFVILAAIMLVIGMIGCGGAEQAVGGGEQNDPDLTVSGDLDLSASGDSALGEEQDEVLGGEAQGNSEHEPAGTRVNVGSAVGEASKPESSGENKNVLTEPEDEAEPADGGEAAKDETGEATEMKMNVQIGDYNFSATLENNKAVEEFIEMMKDGAVTIKMSDYSGFEKVGSLGRSLTTSNSQTTTSAGDIVLYNGNNIVMFYGKNSWSYTRLGKIDDLSDWEKALGSGSITAVFTLIENN